MTDLVEIFREKTESLGWVFRYGRSDFQNLNETESETDPKWYFFLDPITTDNSNSQKQITSGHFMLLSKSDIDQNYDATTNADENEGKFRKNILPKKLFLQNEFRDLLECGDLEINRSSMTDIINFFDDNLDGVLVAFTITQFS